MDTTVSQPRRGVKTRFEFDDALIHWMQDPSGTRSLRAPYASIDIDNPSVVTVKAPRIIRNLVLLFYVLFGCFYFAGLAGRDMGWMWIVACAALTVPLALSEMTTIFDVTSTLLPVQGVAGGVVRVIHDGREDDLMARLTRCRREHFRATLGQLNLSGDLNIEGQKFDWLLANGFIDAAEYAAAREKITAATHLSGFIPRSLN